ncbi:type II toxin-antitoxin system VapC family toxin [Candidatus Methanoperedens nitratireducens]|uniref:Ribonuclease VapC n=1 Tax=Candidatus Methanoperedens nitratireducens TaxID=1392998 RepID=A0A284VNX0_9EURY|nr:PIN domain-containing protein [Candidatus Methanoperedens nitroreducens]SNQ60971.1 putative PilT protein domain protein [Candidatus Methanoperedens nitroreducens]
MIFLDSSAIIAYKNADDINHKKASDIFQKLNAGDYGVGVISEFVLSEVATVLALRKSMETAKEVGNILLEAREIEIMKASEVFERSWEIFSEQENTGLSFVDASNLACMEIRKIRKIATFDKDFIKIKSVEVVND